MNLCKWCGEEVHGDRETHDCCAIYQQPDCPACLQACENNVKYHTRQVREQTEKRERIKARAQVSAG